MPHQFPAVGLPRVRPGSPRAYTSCQIKQETENWNDTQVPWEAGAWKDRPQDRGILAAKKTNSGLPSGLFLSSLGFQTSQNPCQVSWQDKESALAGLGGASIRLPAHRPRDSYCWLMDCIYEQDCMHLPNGECPKSKEVQSGWGAWTVSPHQMTGADSVSCHHSGSGTLTHLIL